MNGVKFDAKVAGVLLEAKGPGYAQFVRNGKFAKWFTGADDMIIQARAQVNAANGNPIVWHVAEKESAAAIQRLFSANNISGINIVHTPAVP